MIPYKQDLIPSFQEIKSINPKLTQKQITKELGYSESTIKRWK